MSPEFLPFRWSPFGRGGESSSFATSLSLSYALFAMCCYARAQREWRDHSKLIAPFTNPVETRSASQAMNLCSQLLGACGCWVLAASFSAAALSIHLKLAFCALRKCLEVLLFLFRRSPQIINAGSNSYLSISDSFDPSKEVAAEAQTERGARSSKGT
jgi:hypothetical protein